MTQRHVLGIAAIALLAGIGTAAAQQPVQQQTPAIDAQKPSTAPPTSSQQQQHEQMLNTRSGMNAKEEPSAHAPSSKSAGTVGTAPEARDTQTTPSKYSERNAALDKLPIMAQPLGLSEPEKRFIYDSVSETRPAPDADAVEAAHALPSNVVLHQFPKKVVDEIPAVRTLHYARFANKVLLVRAPNRIVVGVIEK
jgi:hypothetical protein